MKLRSWLVAVGVSLLMAAPFAAHAEMCESTGEYEYTYGDNESIMQAKQRCEGLALRAAIEQCALFVSSTTNIENYELRDDLVNTIAAALVKNKKILAQRVEGRTIYYKVSIKLDDEQMSRAIEAEQARRGVQAQPQPSKPAEVPVQPQAKPVVTAPATTSAQNTPVVVSTPTAYKVQQKPASKLPSTHISLVLGLKSLNKDDWDPYRVQGFEQYFYDEGILFYESDVKPIHSQGLVGLHADSDLGSLPLNLSCDLQISAKSGSVLISTFDVDIPCDLVGTTVELGAGMRYYLPLPTPFLQPYAGAGLSWVAAAFNMTDDAGEESTLSGSGMGLVVEAGVLVPLGSFFVGAGLRYNTAKAKLEGRDLGDYYDLSSTVDAGGLTIGLTAGLGF